MPYSLWIKRRAQKELSQLPQEFYIRVRDGIYGLAQNPRPTGCLKLTAREGWRIAIGEYRVIYEIDDLTKEITIFHVGHRRDIYK